MALLWSMSRYIHKSYNVSVLIYHMVSPAKYRRVVFDPEVDTVLKEVCLEIAKRYEIEFLEIGADRNRLSPQPRAFSGAVGPELQSDEDRAHNQEYYGARDLPTSPKGQAQALGRRVLG